MDVKMNVAGMKEVEARIEDALKALDDFTAAVGRIKRALWDLHIEIDQPTDAAAD